MYIRHPLQHKFSLHQKESSPTETLLSICPALFYIHQSSHTWASRNLHREYTLAIVVSSHVCQGFHQSSNEAAWYLQNLEILYQSDTQKMQYQTLRYEILLSFYGIALPIIAQLCHQNIQYQYKPQ